MIDDFGMLGGYYSVMLTLMDIKIMRRILVTSLFLVAVSSCTATYTKSPIAMAQIKLAPRESVAVATPGNGTYGEKVYSESGASTANAVRAAFARFAGEITVFTGCQNAICLREKAPFAKYLAVPEILHWEDRATEWSGKKDKLEIKLSIYDSVDMRLLASTILSGKSKWATFGGDHPQDLLATPLTEYVATLY